MSIQKRRIRKKRNPAQAIVRNVIIFVLIYLLLAGAGYMFVRYVEQKNSQVSSLTVNDEVNEFDTTQYEVEINVSKQWVTDAMVGAQYDGTIYNRSANAISDWGLELSVPEGSWIDSDWNGVYEFSMDGRTLYIEPFDYNFTVVPGGHQTFGMIMYTDGSFQPEDMVFSFYKHTNIYDYPAFYVLIALAAIVTVSAIVALISEVRVRAYRNRQDQYKRIINETLDAFANVIDAKDKYTNGHSVRVANYASELARRMGMDEDAQENIHIIALLHDIGKVGIPDAILNKPGKLSDEEMDIIRSHTTVGNRILTNITSVENIVNGASYHHERFDGKGYPEGLAGKDIPLCARIICVADSYDAMSSTRCYREMLSGEEIIAELRRCSGSQFDPEIVPHMIDMIEDMIAAEK